MPNPNNVEPYGKLVHEAKENGGPEEYKTHLKREEYEKGEKDGREEVLKEEGEALLLGFGIAAMVWGVQKIYECVKKKVKKNSKRREEMIAERNELQAKSDDESQSEAEAEEVLSVEIEPDVAEKDEDETKGDSAGATT